MALWQIFSIIGVVAVILEITIPSGFFLNFALAGLLTALISLFVNSIPALVIDFIIISLLSIWLIRPLLIRSKDSDKENGLDGKYIGKTARVIETITKTSGAITIYDERWDARLLHDGDDIPASSEVKIIKNDSLVLYVEKI